MAHFTVTIVFRLIQFLDSTVQTPCGQSDRSTLIQGQYSVAIPMAFSLPRLLSLGLPALLWGCVALDNLDLPHSLAVPTNPTPGTTETQLSQASQPNPSTPTVDYNTLAAEVLQETNRLRSNPIAYSQELASLRPYYQNTLYQPPGQIPLQTQEGWPAVAEAVTALQPQAPLPLLTRVPAMDRATGDHVADQSRTGAVGHQGQDGSAPRDRLERYGRWDVMMAENISYGPNTGLEVVRQLVIDDGVPNRGHRVNLLNPDLHRIGITCGPHPVYRVMCVMIYAGDYYPR